MFGFYIDPLYIILVMPAALFAMWANSRVNSTYKSYSNLKSTRGITSQEACQNILNSNGITDVTIDRISGNLTDHYDPKAKVIRLSDSVYNSTSVAAIGVACHEAGHAIQHAYGYSPLKFRNTLVPITQISSNISVPLVFISLLLCGFGFNTIWLAYVGLIGFAIAAFFQLVTLPVEFDASKRALIAIDNSGYLTDDELYGSKRVLDAAALTYVAALAVSLMSLLRLTLIVLGRSNND